MNTTDENKVAESENEQPEESAVQKTLESIAELESAVEAILFAAGYPVKYQKLAEVLGLSPSDVQKLVEHMAPRFNGEDSDRGIRLLILPDTCQLCTKEVYAPYIREALGIRRGGNLSASSMEVLAVIAYNQPVTRTFIDQVRGVDSSYAVNSLLDKGLIEAVGRLDVVGRPMLYATTDKFLRVFGINSLAELPATEALSVAAQVESEKEKEAEAEAEAAKDASEPSCVEPDETEPDTEPEIEPEFEPEIEPSDDPNA